MDFSIRPSYYDHIFKNVILKLRGIRTLANSLVLVMLFVANSGIVFGVDTLTPRESSPASVEDNQLISNVTNISKDTLLIGADVNYPPFSYLDEQGNPAGHDIEVMNEIASYLGIDVKYELQTWEQSLSSLENGEIDALLGVIHYQNRLDTYDFTIPIWFETYGIFTHLKTRYSKLHDLYHADIAALREDASVERFIIPLGLESSTTYYETLPKAMATIHDETNDYVLAPYSTGIKIIEESGYRNVRVVDPPVLPSYYCIAVQKGDSELLDILNRGIDALKTDGSIEEINERWLKERPKTISLNALLKFIGIASIPAGAAVIVLLLWMWSLKRLVARKTRQLSTANQELKNALAEVKRLRDIIPICSYCKKVRDDEGYWEQIESYFSRHSDSQFSHGICPECQENLRVQINDT